MRRELSAYIDHLQAAVDAEGAVAEDQPLSVSAIVRDLRRVLVAPSAAELEQRLKDFVFSFDVVVHAVFPRTPVLVTDPPSETDVADTESEFDEREVQQAGVARETRAIDTTSADVLGNFANMTVEMTLEEFREMVRSASYADTGDGRTFQATNVSLEKPGLVAMLLEDDEPVLISIAFLSVAARDAYYDALSSRGFSPMTMNGKDAYFRYGSRYMEQMYTDAPQGFPYIYLNRGPSLAELFQTDSADDGPKLNATQRIQVEVRLKRDNENDHFTLQRFTVQEVEKHEWGTVVSGTAFLEQGNGDVTGIFFMYELRD